MAGCPSSPFRRIHTLKEKLEIAADNHDLLATLALMEKVRTGIDQSRLGRDAYNAALSNLAQYGWTREYLALLDEMAKSGKYEMTRETYHQLLKLCNLNALDHLREDTLRDMEKQGLAPDSQTYEYIIEGKCLDDQIEWAMSLLGDAKKKGLVPTVRTINILIFHSAILGELRLTLELLRMRHELNPAIVPQQIYLHALRAAGRRSDMDLVRYLWKLNHSFYLYEVDDGTFINMLNTCGRSGDVEIALGIVKFLPEASISVQEWHLAPVLQAYVVNNDLTGAFEMLHQLKEYGVEPSTGFEDPIVRSLVHKGPEAVDEAYYLLEKMAKEEKGVHPNAWNCLIQACVSINDLGRAVSTYQEAQKIGFSPSLATFNILLDGCRKERSPSSAFAIQDEMKSHGITMDVVAWEKLFFTALVRNDFDRQLFILEEMKAATVIPTYDMYRELIIRLAEKEDKRYRLLFDEMASYGIALDANLANEIRKLDSEARGNPDPRAMRQNRPSSSSPRSRSRISSTD